jgi:hypothetical protein
MDNNRRNYFRIHTNLNYELVEIDAEDVSLNTLHALAHHDYQLLKEMTRLQSESNSTLGVIEDKHREVAAYLQTIDQRLNTLSYLVIARQMEFKDKALLSDLSASGIRLALKNKYRIDQHVFFHLLLSPCMLYIPTIAKVIKISEQNKAYSVVFEFVYIEEDDRDKIAKHVIKLQAFQKRQEENS